MRKNTTAAMAWLMAFGLSGCDTPSDPTKEAPVEVTPGLYKVTFGGAGLAGAMAQGGPGSDRVDEICLAENEVGDFPGNLVKNYLVVHPSCDHEENPRVGNSFSGKVTCPVDPDKGAGSTRFDYTGTISASAVQIESKMSLDVKFANQDDAAELERGKALLSAITVVTKAQRAGDCP